MADIIKIRRDTAANWTSNNPTLAADEVAYETDTGRWKRGDGATAWNSLAYLLGSVVNDEATPGNNKVYGTNGSGVKGWKDDPAGGGGVTDIDSIGTGGSAQTVNFNVRRMTKITLTADITITLTDGASASSHLTGTIQITQDSTARTITWAGNVIFPGGIEPTISAGSGDIDLFMFEWNGADWVLTNFIADVQ